MVTIVFMLDTGDYQQASIIIIPPIEAESSCAVGFQTAVPGTVSVEPRLVSNCRLPCTRRLRQGCLTWTGSGSRLSVQ